MLEAMAEWMRFRGMSWRPTLEMSGAPMAVGLTLILGYWLDLVAKNSLIEVQTSLSCPDRTRLQDSGGRVR